jgi:hypothetical protein
LISELVIGESGAKVIRKSGHQVVGIRISEHQGGGYLADQRQASPPNSQWTIVNSKSQIYGLAIVNHLRFTAD